jgi:hypothetical protein
VFELFGEIGRNYRIQSSLDLATWTNEDSFPQTPVAFADIAHWVLGADQLFPPLLTSVVFNTNGSSIFTITNNIMSKFLRAVRYQPANEVCINNMRQIRFARLLWQRDQSPLSSSRLNVAYGYNFASYFPQGALPHCPEDPDDLFGTSYSLSVLTLAPFCNIDATHTLEEPQ